jgi:hypothetical protein
MGAQQFRKMVMLAKLHDPGQTVQPVATDALRVDADVDWTPDGDKVERNVVSHTFSREGNRIGAKSQKIGFKHEACGAGLDVGGKPNTPYYDGLLQACGMTRTDDLVILFLSSSAGVFTPGEAVTGAAPAASGLVRFFCGDVLVITVASGTFQAGQTVTGGTSAATGTVSEKAAALEYKPATVSIAQQKCMTFFFHRDGHRKALRDARGTFSLDAPSGKIARFSFSFTAPWLSPADQPLPAPTLPDIVPAIFVDAKAQIGAYKPHFTSLKLDLANQVSPRPDANSPSGIVEYFISGRNPVGSVDPEMDDLAAFNPYSLWESSTPTGLVARIGDTPGNRIVAAVPKLRASGIAERERSGLGNYDLSFDVTRDGAGDDELRLFFC